MSLPLLAVSQSLLAEDPPAQKKPPPGRINLIVVGGDEPCGKLGEFVFALIESYPETPRKHAPSGVISIVFAKNQEAVTAALNGKEFDLAFGVSPRNKDGEFDVVFLVGGKESQSINGCGLIELVRNLAVLDPCSLDALKVLFPNDRQVPFEAVGKLGSDFNFHVTHATFGVSCGLEDITAFLTALWNCRFGLSE